MLAACGTVERDGRVGDRLEGGGLEVTVSRVDRHPRVPEHDVTGLSVPARGYRLVGVRVRVCSDHGGAIGPYDFELGTDRGDARLKYPAGNYDKRFETVRTGCGGGWVVFEAPRTSRPTRVRFGFEDTGSAQQPQDEVDARFSWDVE